MITSHSFDSFKGDIVAMFVESCAKYRVKPGIYCATATDYLLNISGVRACALCVYCVMCVCDVRDDDVM